ncbi:unnamed protein product [Penicillium viridicatum]
MPFFTSDWWNILLKYDTLMEGHAAYVSETSLAKANVVSTKIRNQDIRARLFTECKRPPQNKANELDIPAPNAFDKASKRLQK